MKFFQNWPEDIFQVPQALTITLPLSVTDSSPQVIYSSDVLFGAEYVQPPDARLDIFGTVPGSGGGGIDRVEFRPSGVIKDNPVSEVERAGWHDFSAPLWFGTVGERHTQDDWYLEVKHRNRSLQEIMTLTQWHERTLGLGILLLLALSVAMIFMASQRARKFAQLQVEFVAAVSHELRTPLAVLCSAADHLADGVVPGPQQLDQ